MKKILLIEDNHCILENLTEFLTLEGFEVLAANCGKDGVHFAITDQPDLILCDVLMYEMNGFQVLTTLINCAATMHIPFIFSTSLSENIDTIKTLELGADDFLVKPYELENLLSVINFWLKSGKREKIGNANNIQLIA